MAIGLALAAVSGGLQIFGRLRQANIDSQLASINARRLKQEASAIKAMAQEDVQFDINAQDARRGSMIASFASRGIDVSQSTTPVDTLLTQLRIDENNNARKLYEADLQAYNLRFQAKYIKFAGKEGKKQAIIGAFGDLFSAGGRAAGAGA